MTPRVSSVTFSQQAIEGFDHLKQMELLLCVVQSAVKFPDAATVMDREYKCICK